MAHSIKREIDRETVAKRTEIWLEHERAVSAWCKSKFSDNADEILDGAMIRFLEGHDITKDYQYGSMSIQKFAKLKCLEEARKLGIIFQKKKKKGVKEEEHEGEYAFAYL